MTAMALITGNLSKPADLVLPLKRKPFNPDKQSSSTPPWEM